MFIVAFRELHAFTINNLALPLPLPHSLVKPSRNVPESVAKVAIEKAFKLWEEGSQDILKFIGIESDEADIKLGFYVREHGCGKNQGSCLW